MDEPTRFSSSSASANNFRIFASDSPTYLSRICGPLTIFGSRAFNIFPICLENQFFLQLFTPQNHPYRAIRVFPVPGGPYNKIPRQCFIPIQNKSSIFIDIQNDSPN